jgi:hypothetical protein
MITTYLLRVYIFIAVSSIFSYYIRKSGAVSRGCCTKLNEEGNIWNITTDTLKYLEASEPDT